MTDERPVEDATAALARLQAELTDLRTTLTARASRSPTGDIEPTVRTTAKAQTLLLQGQTINRVDYPVLWQWASDQALVGIAGLFTPGNGTTTFGLPDFRGRVPIGSGTLGSSSYPLGHLSGATTVTIAAANLPVHDHSVSASIANHSNHNHTFNTQQLGGHGGHVENNNIQRGTGPGGDHGHPPSWGFDAGHHGHGGETTYNSAGSHSWNIDVAPFGSATPTGLDVRQPSIAINWLIWV